VLCILRKIKAEPVSGESVQQKSSHYFQRHDWKMKPANNLSRLVRRIKTHAACLLERSISPAKWREREWVKIIPPDPPQSYRFSFTHTFRGYTSCVVKGPIHVMFTARRAHRLLRKGHGRWPRSALHPNNLHFQLADRLQPWDWGQTWNKI